MQCFENFGWGKCPKFPPACAPVFDPYLLSVELTVFHCFDGFCKIF